jgi:hypothetical protein
LVFLRQIESITGERLALGIVLGDASLDQPQRITVAPSVKCGWGEATPPDFIAKAVRLSSRRSLTPPPCAVRQRRLNDHVVFLSAYCGSGLVTQCFARFQ